MINGGIKFFERAMNLYKDNTIITAISNTDGAKYALDPNIYTQWVSVGSNDTIQEELEISLNGLKVIDRMLLLDFNFKEFEVLYRPVSGIGAYQSFTNVIGINGVEYTGVESNDYSLNSAYFEFDQVTAAQIKIIINKTQVADAEKFLTTFIVTKEIGTFVGFPRIEPKANRNEEKVKTMSGKYIVQKGFDTIQIKLNLKTHPIQADIDLVNTLFDREESFIIYACGGRYGSQYFRVLQKGFRIQDAYNVQLVGAMDNKYEKGVYTLGVSKTVTFEEHV